MTFSGHGKQVGGTMDNTAKMTRTAKMTYKTLMAKKEKGELSPDYLSYNNDGTACTYASKAGSVWGVRILVTDIPEEIIKLIQPESLQTNGAT
jgi:hypothetical protein